MTSKEFGTNESQGVSRRTFLKGASGAALSLPLSGSVLFGQSETAPRIALIGTSGRGSNHVSVMSKLGVECPCYCDVDKKRQKPAAKTWPDAKAYQDYRRMFDEMHNEIDGVVVCTPDHHHFPASAIALQHGIHVYCEKPLTWSLREARKLTEMAAECNLATQMGNQLHDTRFWDKIIGWIRAGAIGQVQETHTWNGKSWSGVKSPQLTSPPDHIDWDVWLGPASKHRFSNAYHPSKWRGYHNFGTGTLGDMACHLMDGMFMAMQPGAPESVELMESKGSTATTFPEESVVKWEFDPEDQPAFTSYWYDGSDSNKPDKPDGISKKRWNKAGSGNLFIGSEGAIFAGYSLGRASNGALVFKKDPVLLPEGRAAEFDESMKRHMPQAADGRHHAEFLKAVTGEEPLDFPSSDFQYGGPLTEVVLLGSLAQKRGAVGKTLAYDANNVEIPNDEKADAMMGRDPRSGWKVV